MGRPLHTGPAPSICETGLPFARKPSVTVQQQHMWCAARLNGRRWLDGAELHRAGVRLTIFGVKAIWTRGQRAASREVDTVAIRLSIDELARASWSTAAGNGTIEQEGHRR